MPEPQGKKFGYNYASKGFKCAVCLCRKRNKELATVNDYLVCQECLKHDKDRVEALK